MLNTLLDDGAYRAWLLDMCDEPDLQYDYGTPMAEYVQDYADEVSAHSVERHLGGDTDTVDTGLHGVICKAED